MPWSSCRFDLRALLIAISAALSMGWFSSASAQESVARIPVTIVSGRLVVAVQLAAQKRIAANLFIDFESTVGLVLHNRAAQGIVAENDDGTGNPITIHLPDLDIPVERRELGEEKFYEDFTKWYSKELGENAIVGTIGARILSNYHVTFDLAAGMIELSAPHAALAPERRQDSGGEVVSATILDDIVWLPVSYGAGRRGVIGLGTTWYDTRIDRDLAEELGKPAGDIGPARLGNVDLDSIVALRPERVNHVHPDGVFGMLGLNVLEHFRVEVDRTNRSVRFTPTAPATFPTADREFFKARVRDEAAAIAKWLEQFPNARLRLEAAKLLVDLRLAEGASEPEIRSALVAVQDAGPSDLRATSALELLRQMQQAGRNDYAKIAGELGISAGRSDRYPEVVHRLHGKLGSILLEEGDRRAAWKHLLSAAFGLPEDGPINLDLARCYEAEGRFTRAYSRYLQALLSAESGADAIDGLERTQPKLPDLEAFSVESVERMIEGKVEGFGVATRYLPEDGKQPNRAVLVEYFSNADFEFEIGVVLGRDGLRDHFGKERAILVRYDVPKSSLEALVNPLAIAAWKRVGGQDLAHRADGIVELPIAARARFKNDVFEACRRAIVDRLAIPSQHRIEVEASVDRERIRGRATFHGPECAAYAEILAIERGVLHPGKSKIVVHRNVARAALTPRSEGVPYEPVDDAMSVEFDRSIAEIVAENGAFLDAEAKAGRGDVSRISVRIDPKQISIVAVLRDAETHEVLQAIQFDPELPESMR